MVHIPVLLKESLEHLNIEQGNTIVDATAGLGGHTLGIAKHTGKKGTVIAIERDPKQVDVLCENIIQSKYTHNIIVINGNYVDMDVMCQEEGFTKVNGVLFDVGFSSWQIQESGRGFSFLKNEALDMRYEPTPEHISAYEVVNSYAKNDLERVLFEYGEEKRAHQIVQHIVRTRRKQHIQTTGDLVNIVSQVVKARPGMSPATKTFQALRIEVNNEIRTLEKGLHAAMSIVGNKGRIVVISFHSLEDRVVKHTFQEWKKQERGNIITRKVITPHFTEVQRNRKARSAKLRTFSVIKH